MHIVVARNVGNEESRGQFAIRREPDHDNHSIEDEPLQDLLLPPIIIFYYF